MLKDNRVGQYVSHILVRVNAIRDILVRKWD